jgi:putative membrane protein
MRVFRTTCSVSGLIAALTLAVPAAAVSLSATGPAQPLPEPVVERASTVAPSTVSGADLQAVSAGSAALFPLMAADVAVQEPAVVDASTSVSGGTGKTADDIAFFARAAESGRKEMQAARDAQPLLSDPELKQLAEAVARHHEEANERLTRLAETKGWPLPAADVDAAPSGGAASAEFDERWTDEMIAGHERSVALYRAQAQGGEDKDLRKYARDTLPTIEQHLDMLRRMQK